MADQKHIQTVTGTVVKKSGIQTIRITTKITKVHPIYKKRYTQSRFYLAHDASDAIAVGDKVVIAACKPFSKQKTWQVIQKIDS